MTEEHLEIGLFALSREGVRLLGRTEDLDLVQVVRERLRLSLNADLGEKLPLRLVSEGASGSERSAWLAARSRRSTSDPTEGEQ